MVSSERASQEEQNGASFSFIAPSCEELCVQKVPECIPGKGHQPCGSVCVLVQLYFSITIQQICMKFGVVITPNSGCLSLVLCHWSSFGFGIGNVLVSRFCPPFVKVVSHHALVYGLSIAPQLSGE